MHERTRFAGTIASRAADIIEILTALAAGLQPPGSNRQVVERGGPTTRNRRSMPAHDCSRSFSPKKGEAPFAGKNQCARLLTVNLPVSSRISPAWRDISVLMVAVSSTRDELF